MGDRIGDDDDDDGDEENRRPPPQPPPPPSNNRSRTQLAAATMNDYASSLAPVLLLALFVFVTQELTLVQPAADEEASSLSTSTVPPPALPVPESTPAPSSTAQEPPPPSPPLRTRPYSPRGRSPFFPRDGCVRDFWLGDVGLAEVESRKYDRALLMCYAPWDVDSQHARVPFSRLCRALAGSGTFFAAVDCWNPSGDCRMRRLRAALNTTEQTKVWATMNSFPRLLLYWDPKSGDPSRTLEYGGPLTFHHMAVFLGSSSRPVRFLASRGNLDLLRAEHGGTSAVGYFPDLYQDKVSRERFLAFLQASYELLKVPTLGHVAVPFGVVVGPGLALSLGLNATSSPVRMFLPDGRSEIFPPNLPRTNASLLALWIRSKAARSGGPSLASWIGSLGRRSRALSDSLHSGTGNSLVMFFDWGGGSRAGRALLTEYRTLALLYKHCPPAADSDYHRHLARKNLSGLLSALESIRLNLPESVASLNRTVGLFNPRSSDNSCDIVEAEYRRPRRADLDSYGAVDGLGCRDNLTLNFYQADASTQHELMRRMGLDPSGGPAVVIVSMKDEVVWKMPGSGCDSSSVLEALPAFLRSYHDGDLWRSSLKPLLRQSDVGKKLDGGSACQGCFNNRSLLEVLNSDSLRGLLMGAADLGQPGFVDPRPVLLLYSTAACSFCASIAVPVFHSLSLLFHSGGHQSPLRFAMVDPTENDLPWQFGPLSVPSILFIPEAARPAASKPSEARSETRPFPEDTPITVANLLRFIFANLPLKTKLELALKFCDISCQSKLREEIEDKDVSSLRRPGGVAAADRYRERVTKLIFDRIR